MSTFNAGAIEASLTLDRSSWNRELKELQVEIDRLENTTITIGIDADSDNFQVVADNVELFLEDLDKQSATVGIDADADKFYAAQAEVENMIELMDAENINIGVETNGLPKTMAELAELNAAITATNAHDVEVDVKYDKNNLEELVGKASSGGGGGGGSMGLLGILIAAAIALSPILGVAISALSAVIVAFTGALVAALGPLALLIGFIIYLTGIYAKAKKAGDPLTHGMQELSDALHGLSDEFHKIVDGKLGDLGFGLMAQGIRLLTDILPMLEPILIPVIGLMSDILDTVGKFVKSPEFARWIDFFGKFGVDMLGGFMSIIGNLIRFLMNLFIAMKPFSRRIIKALVDDVQRLAEWSQHLGKNKGFKDWVKTAQQYGPMLLELVGDIIKAFTHIGDAIRPFAKPMIQALDSIADAIQRIPVKYLTPLIGIGAGLFAAWKVLVPVFSVLSTAFELISGAIAADSIAFGLALGPLLLIIALIAALAAIVYIMWTKNKQFRDSLIKAWDDIKKAVMPIIQDIVDLVKQEWPKIQKTAEEVWASVQDIFVQAAGIIQQIVFFATQAISWIWKHFGKYLLAILKATMDLILGVVKGAFQILDGIFKLINDVLHGRWSKLWGDIKLIAKGAWGIIVALFKASWAFLKNIFEIGIHALNMLWHLLWGWIKDGASAAWDWLKSKWGDFVDWISGIPSKIGHALSGMWDGLVNGFRDALNKIIDWWNSLSFGIPGFDPPGPGPKFPGFTVHTPHLNHFAHGGVVDTPQLAVVGDAATPEIISPEDKMAEIVSKHSPRMDYRKMADALSQVLAPLLGGIVDKETLLALLEKVGPKVHVDASNDDRSARAIAAELSYELRVLGYGAAS